VAPVLAAVAAAVGWIAHRGGRAGLWQLLGDMARERSRMRADLEVAFAQGASAAAW
jgi:hypothetical protein